MSLFGSLLSSAMTAQLRMMVMMIVHSNTGQLINQIANLRGGLEVVNKNSEVGPWREMGNVRDGNPGLSITRSATWDT